LLVNVFSISCGLLTFAIGCLQFRDAATQKQEHSKTMFPNSSKASKGGFGSFTTSTTTLSYLTPPPDFSAIPHEVVVPFKNLLKKASTTKEKALQDILAYVKGQPSDTQGLQDSIIQAYVR